MIWRKNWEKYQRRKAIRAEYSRRMATAPRGSPAWGDALEGYMQVQAKIKRFYAIAPMDEWWPIRRFA